MCSAPTTSARGGSETHAFGTRAYVRTQARVRACERASRHTRVERGPRGREHSRLGSSTWLARERAVLGSGAPRPEAEGESERDRKRERERVREKIRSFVRVVSAQEDKKVEEEGIDYPFFSLSPPRSLFVLARWATPPKEGQRSILGPTRVVTSPYAAAEYEVTHARSSTIR